MHFYYYFTNGYIGESEKMISYIKKLERTCDAAPLQYEGELVDGEYIYFRDRHGQWCLDICDSKVDWHENKFQLSVSSSNGNLSFGHAEELIEWIVRFYCESKNVPMESK